jgi:hypothetical protein
MRDLKFLARMVFAFAAIVLILGVTHHWDEAETRAVRAAYSRST